MPNSWHLLHTDGSYYGSYILVLLAVIVFTLVALARWIRRTGLRPTATRGWITIATLLSIYDIALNAIGHRRYGDVWWASLSIRSATYAVLLGGLIVSTATQLQRLERYATAELARAEGEVNSWAEVTERLLATTSALSGAVTAEDVALLLAAAAAGAIEVDDAAVYVRDERSPGRLRLIGGLAARSPAPALAAAPGTPHADAMLRGAPVFLENHPQIAQAYPFGTGVPGRDSAQALVALPLVVGDAAVGVLLLTGGRSREFRQLDRELLSALARVGAQALARALLYEQQSSVASTLQAALLPKSLPFRTDVELVGRYLPATAGVDVGGDWYDVLELGGAKLLLVVGDVMGKGVPAATLMGQLRSAVRTLAAVDPEPAAILSGLDQLAMAFPPDDIATLAVVALDVETGTATVANAGHLPPLVFAPGESGAPAAAVRDTSPPIGAPVSGPRASGRFELPAGAALLLLTDGLVEERGGDLDARMTALTAQASELLADPAADLDSVTDALVQPRVHRDDDVTVLLARLGPRADWTAAAHPACILDVLMEQDSGAVANARVLLRGALRDHRIHVTPEVVDSLLLVTSELVTNGLRHGEPPVQLTVEHTVGRLRVTVSNRGPNQPRPRVADPDATGGRGLFLVSALATAWKIERRGGETSLDGIRTTVWAELAL
jgi:serine phosphatase RsbU (regulator of sigma subunit)/anti-sigma regulatory factor (Ser/Thr protein kinase)